jgi:hypothetical protein
MQLRGCGSLAAPHHDDTVGRSPRTAWAASLMPAPSVAAALCVPPRRWPRGVQAFVVVLVLLLSGAVVLSELERDHELSEADLYARTIRELDALVFSGHLNSSTLVALRRFAERHAAAPQFSDITDGDADSDYVYHLRVTGTRGQDLGLTD